VRWTGNLILQRLRAAHARGGRLSYNAMCRRNQALLSAAAYHFGSYAQAIRQAGLDYSEISRRPRWSRKRIILLLKSARRKGRDLSWSAVIRRRDELSRAAWVAVGSSYFGSWVRALHAAGIDPDEYARRTKWDRESIAYELRELLAAGEPVNSFAVQKNYPALHAAALRHFSSFDAALRKARIKPSMHRKRKPASRRAARRPPGRG
jgi:hypothetical protein